MRNDVDLSQDGTATEDARIAALTRALAVRDAEVAGLKAALQAATAAPAPALGWRRAARQAARRLVIGLLGQDRAARLAGRLRGGLGGEGAELSRRVDRLRGRVGATPQAARSPAAPFDPRRMRICWIIPDFIPGAGGHMTIFRIASHLESYGHEVSFLVQSPSRYRSGAEAAQAINAHFQPFRGRVEILGTDLPVLEGDALVATDRFTCYPAQALAGFRRKFYFVQDHETLFYPMGTEALLSENTYAMGFDCLCAGDWLAGLMRDRFGAWAMSWPLAYDPAAYFEDPGAPRAEDRIAFYGRYVTERRAVELGVMALDILHARGVRFHVDFFGWPLRGLRAGYAHTDHGVLGASALGALYRQATVGMVFSATNHSLVNREMMACGLPVVDLDVEGVRAVFPGDVLHRARPDPEAIADALQALLADPARRERLRAAGLAHVAGLSWDGAARLVERAIAARIAETA
jgi:glycosyltransferase involved in cell wall biosynthesis